MAPEIRTKFITKVGQKGLSFEEVACISGLSGITLFKFAAGKIDLSEGDEEKLAAILDCKVGELFPKKKGEWLMGLECIIRLNNTGPIRHLLLMPSSTKARSI